MERFHRNPAVATPRCLLIACSPAMRKKLIAHSNLLMEKITLKSISCSCVSHSNVWCLSLSGKVLVGRSCGVIFPKGWLFSSAQFGKWGYHCLAVITLSARQIAASTLLTTTPWLSVFWLRVTRSGSQSREASSALAEATSYGLWCSCPVTCPGGCEPWWLCSVGTQLATSGN